METFNGDSVGTRLVVKVPEKLGKSESGIITGDKEKPDRGIIVAAGALIKDPNVRVGRLAVFNKYAGQEFKEDGVMYLLLNEGEIYFTRDV
jgi:co-chaperonin GroES (HSP10)